MCAFLAWKALDYVAISWKLQEASRESGGLPYPLIPLLKSIAFQAMMATGLDQVTAFSAVAATLNNLGPGLGDVSSGFMSISDTAKWISVVGMLLGRLEIFTLLVLITPTFWRH